MAAEAAFLLNDIQGEKSLGKIVGLLGSNSKRVCRGELLLTIPRVKVIPRKDGKPAHNYQLASDPAVTLFCTEHDVAPISDYEFDLLMAVRSPSARYQILQNDLLDWAVEVKNESNVLVTLPSHRAIPNQSALATVKYVGPLPKECGMLFGVEIIVS